MKLHYVALRQDMFLYMDILYTQILKWKDFLFSERVGGVSSLPDGLNGVSGIGVLYLWGPPLLASDLDFVMSCSLCQIYCTKHSGAGCFRSVVLRSTVWYLGSYLLCLSLECRGPKAAPALSQWWENTSFSQWLYVITDAFTVFYCLEFFFSHNTHTFYP